MINLFGERVAIVELEEEIESEIALAGKRNYSYFVGKVHAASKKAQEILNVDDTVLFQAPTDMRTGKVMGQVFKAGDEIVQIQHSRDMIARLGKGTVVNIDTFEPLGEWVLAEARLIKRESTILLPDNVRETPDFFRYHVVKKGSKVPEEIQVGDEIVVEPNRLNPIGLSGKNYFYCDRGQIAGVVGNTDHITLAIAD